MISYTIHSSIDLFRNIIIRLGNYILKPVNLPSFEFDILSRSDEEGVFNYRTPNNGAVKYNNLLQGVTLNQGTEVQVVSSGGNFSTIDDFPKNVSNALLPDTPVTNPSLFLPLLYDSSTDQWLENPITDQVHEWRIDLDIKKTSTAPNRDLICILENPSSTFVLEDRRVLSAGNVNLNQKIVFSFKTVADANSIGSGYIIKLKTPNRINQDITINNLNILRVSNEKL